MADPIVVPLEEDPTVIEQEIYSYIQSFYPEWDPKEPHVIVLISEAIAAEISDLRRLATDVGPEILAYLGRLLGIVQFEASPAFAVVNIQAIDTTGYTIPEGTEMRVLIHSDEFMGFETVNEVVIPPGSLSALAVPIRATSNGAEGNNLSSNPELLDILDYIQSITLVGVTSGGEDAETIDEYLARLRTRFQLLADRPITARDFERYVETIIPGVDRALCLDTYNPEDDTYDNERMVTMAAIDADGVGVSAEILQQIKEALEAVREINFIVNTTTPTYTNVVVSATVVAQPGWDATELKAVIEANVIDFLNPANFGKPPISSGDSPLWTFIDKVRYADILWIIRSTDGVAYIDGSVIIGGQPNTDFTLPGAAPLPQANSTVTITVNES